MDVYLTGMHLKGVNLINVHLTGVYIMGVHLTAVILTGKPQAQVRWAGPGKLLGRTRVCPA